MALERDRGKREREGERGRERGRRRRERGRVCVLERKRRGERGCVCLKERERGEIERKSRIKKRGSGGKMGMRASDDTKNGA